MLPRAGALLVGLTGAGEAKGTGEDMGAGEAPGLVKLKEARPLLMLLMGIELVSARDVILSMVPPLALMVDPLLRRGSLRHLAATANHFS